MIDIARERGFGAMVLSSAVTMHAAHRLYERLGFSRLPERDWSPSPGVQLVAYTLPL
jgi:ribosomal protein S18 acetylase RimI-like enzyme